MRRFLGRAPSQQLRSAITWRTYKFAVANGGREYFDYITFNAGSGRLYLSRGTEVLVVDSQSGKELGKIDGLKVSHGVAVVPEVGRGFITDGTQGKAIIFDLKTLQKVGEASAAPDNKGRTGRGREEKETREEEKRKRILV